MTTYHFYSDPGHGWLRVPREELRELGIESKISKYSYQKGSFVYLEEDCDAPEFINALSEARGVSNLGLSPEQVIGAKIVPHVSTKRDSKIRGYDSYQIDT